MDALGGVKGGEGEAVGDFVRFRLRLWGAGVCSFSVGVCVLNLNGLGGGGKSSSDRSAQNFGTYCAFSLPLLSVLVLIFSVALNTGTVTAVTALSPVRRDELDLADKRALGRAFALSTTSAIYLGFAFRDFLGSVAIVLWTASDATESVSPFVCLRSVMLFDPETIGSLALTTRGG